MSNSPAHKRILLKLSGEALMGDDAFGINRATIVRMVEEIAEERADIKVCKLDVDQEPELARQYRVMSIPTFLVFKEGEVVKRDMGVMSKEEVEGLIG